MDELVFQEGGEKSGEAGKSHSRGVYDVVHDDDKMNWQQFFTTDCCYFHNYHKIRLNWSKGIVITFNIFNKVIQNKDLDTMKIQKTNKQYSRGLI